MYEWLALVGGRIDEVPEGAAERRAWLAQRWQRSNVTDAHMPALQKYYGADASKIKYVEAFEIAEYGYQPSEEEIKRFFPMLGNF